MDPLVLRETDLEVDLEIGSTICEQDLSSFVGAKGETNTFLAKLFGGFTDGSVKGVKGGNVSCNIVANENVKFLTVEKVELKEMINSAEKNSVKEKRKKASNKKSPKPPRPPRGPSLDAADQKLIREISEIVMLKRAKVERMKALKKMKASKPPSSSSNLYAMVFTVLFCLVIIFQGMSSKPSTSASSQLSPVSAEASEGDLISVHYYQHQLPSKQNGLASDSPNVVEQVTGLAPQGKLRKGAG